MKSCNLGKISIVIRYARCGRGWFRACLLGKLCSELVALVIRWSQALRPHCWAHTLRSRVELMRWARWWRHCKIALGPHSRLACWRAYFRVDALQCWCRAMPRFFAIVVGGSGARLEPGALEQLLGRCCLISSRRPRELHFRVNSDVFFSKKRVRPQKRLLQEIKIRPGCSTCTPGLYDRNVNETRGDTGVRKLRLAFSLSHGSQTGCDSGTRFGSRWLSSWGPLR